VNDGRVPGDDQKDGFLRRVMGARLEALGEAHDAPPPDFSSGIGLFCFTPRMKSQLAALMTMVAVVLAPPVFASGKKENKASITFHMETEGTDNPKMIFPQMANGQTRYFRRTSEINLKDVTAFSPFPADNGQGFGLVLKLKPTAVNRFAAITAASQGRWLISQVNGRAVDGVLIDKTVNDGFIVIWKGVGDADIAILDKELPRIGAAPKKKNLFGL